MNVFVKPDVSVRMACWWLSHWLDRVLLVLVLFSCSCTSLRNEKVQICFTNPDGSRTPKVLAEIVATPEQRAFGLMYRKELPLQTGMFFVFPDVVPRSFWMKNTYISLDIVFLDEGMKVVSFVEQARPLSTEPLLSQAPAKFALEVSAGSVKVWGLKVGARANLYGNLPVALS